MSSWPLAATRRSSCVARWTASTRNRCAPRLLWSSTTAPPDDTPKILAEYASNNDWIRVVTRADRGSRSVGPGVIEAFYAGLQTVDLDDFDFVCKLDLDLVLPPKYFELLMAKMAANRAWGVSPERRTTPARRTSRGLPGGADPGGDRGRGIGWRQQVLPGCVLQTDRRVRTPGDVGTGSTATARACLGWQVGSADDPDLRFIHLRPMGSSHGTMWQGRKRHGFGQYFMGSSMVFMVASCAYRAVKQPYVVGAIAMLVGYLESMVKRLPQYGDVALPTLSSQIPVREPDTREAPRRCASRGTLRGGFQPDARVPFRFLRSGSLRSCGGNGIPAAAWTRT